MLADGELDAIDRVIKGEMYFDEDRQQLYYLKGGNIVERIDPNNPSDIVKIYLHEGIPQSYWGEVEMSSAKDLADAPDDTAKDADFYYDLIDE